MGELNVSATYAAAHETLGMLALNDGLEPWQRAIGLLQRCYIHGRDYMVPVVDVKTMKEEMRDLAAYMPAPYTEDQKTIAIRWMSDDEKVFHKDLLYGVTMDMAATDSNNPILAAMLLQAEVLKSYGKLAFELD